MDPCAELALDYLGHDVDRPALRLVTAQLIARKLHPGMSLAADAAHYMARILDDPKNAHDLTPEVRIRSEVAILDTLGIKSSRGSQAAHRIVSLIRWDCNHNPHIWMQDKLQCLETVERIARSAGMKQLHARLSETRNKLLERTEILLQDQHGAGLFYPCKQESQMTLQELDRTVRFRDPEAFTQQTDIIRATEPDRVLEAAIRGMRASPSHDTFWQSCVTAAQHIIARPKLLNASSPDLVCSVIDYIDPSGCSPEAKLQLARGLHQLLAQDHTEEALGHERYLREALRATDFARTDPALVEKTGRRVMEFISKMKPGHEKFSLTHYFCVVLPCGAPLEQVVLGDLIWQIRTDLGNNIPLLQKRNVAEYAAHRYIDPAKRSVAQAVYESLSRRMEGLPTLERNVMPISEILPFPRRDHAVATARL
jgi:hypothetical protein